MKTLTALFLLASLFIHNLFAVFPANRMSVTDFLAQNSFMENPVDSIIDIDSLLNDTAIFKLVNDTIIKDSVCIDSVKSDSIFTDSIKSDSILIKKTDTISKPMNIKKPVVVIPQSVLDLRKIYSDYRKYSEWAQERWDDIYLSLSEIKMSPDYYKFVVPLTYYSKPFVEASSVNEWYPKDILVEDSVRKANMLEKGIPHMYISSELDKKINRQLLDFYVNYPELVLQNETKLDSLEFLSLEDMTSAHKKDNIIEFVQNNAGFGQMSDSELLVLKPNFWTYGGSGYLQFSQNYISENWYKGGESTKS